MQSGHVAPLHIERNRMYLCYSNWLMYRLAETLIKLQLDEDRHDGGRTRGVRAQTAFSF